MLSLKGLLGVVALSGVLGVLAVPAPAAADPPVRIEGGGSSWASNAVQQRIADVAPRGLQAVYTANGSSQGRKDFALRNSDFAVSDIPYQGTDPVSGETDTALGRPFGYVPVVAGGTSFPYHITVNGQLLRDLRLSGLTLAKIFTNQITDWADPAITADNNGRALPSMAITPVVHAEGSGASYQLSRYLAHVYPTIWTSFAANPTPTSYYPRQGRAIAVNGSDGVINYVRSAQLPGQPLHLHQLNHRGHRDSAAATNCCCCMTSWNPRFTARPTDDPGESILRELLELTDHARYGGPRGPPVVG